MSVFAVARQSVAVDIHRSAIIFDESALLLWPPRRPVPIRPLTRAQARTNLAYRRLHAFGAPCIVEVQPAWWASAPRRWTKALRKAWDTRRPLNWGMLGALAVCVFFWASVAVFAARVA